MVEIKKINFQSRNLRAARPGVRERQRERERESLWSLDPLKMSWILCRFQSCAAVAQANEHKSVRANQRPQSIVAAGHDVFYLQDVRRNAPFRASAPRERASYSSSSSSSRLPFRKSAHTAVRVLKKARHIFKTKPGPCEAGPLQRPLAAVELHRRNVFRRRSVDACRRVYVSICLHPLGPHLSRKSEEEAFRALQRPKATVREKRERT